MVNVKMQAICAAEGLPTTTTDPFGQEPSSDSFQPGTQPVTPKLAQGANSSGGGQPTPDTSPESINTAPSHRKMASVRLGDRKDVGLVTTSALSKAPVTEDITDTTNKSDHCSHHSIDSESSEEASTVSYLDQKESYSSVSVVSIYHSVINFFNLASQRKSRADNARVQETIRLIKSLPTIRRPRVQNPTRTLTPREYEQLLTIIEDQDSFPDKLRFEYTHSTQQFEIRMTTDLHEGMVGQFNESFGKWKGELEKSSNLDISDAAGTLHLKGNKSIPFPVPEGGKDKRSPDGQIKHRCKHGCDKPALLLEVGWAKTKELKEKAKNYIVRSEGKIRTVIVVHMGEMYAAERKNERRLRKMYRTGQVDESGRYSYPEDEKNITGEASILVWRAVQKKNAVTIGRVQEKKFRDDTGKAIESASLRILLQDCVCKDMIDSAKESQAPALEISSATLCDIIEFDLKDYRRERAEIIREGVEKEKQKKANEEERERQREEGCERRATEARGPEVRGRVTNGIWFGRLRSKKS
ncbi:hypothetical protein F4824DRAFT_439473 [Ustulina deusta]|nr:hypothetical protein F4824DRAFT_439473 [Ustulina deusta]